MELISIIILSLMFFMLFMGCFWMIVFLDNLDSIYYDPKPNKKYSISVLIPAYNEEKSIIKTIDSVLKQNYDKDFFEVIVINDGSTDKTKKLCEEYHKKGLIKLVNKKNGGKASAMNLGIKYAKNELIYVLDADSFADKNSFNHLVGYFNNPNVAAVTSSMKVSNKKTVWQKIQWLEYLFSVLMRKVMSLFNCLYVTPGPGSIYRKSVILEVGGFCETTLTEDMEIGFNIQNHGYIIENSLNSIVLTNTPKKLSELVKQRRRWYTGFIEDSYKYKHFFFNKKKGFLGMFLLPTNIFSTFALMFLSFYGIYSLIKLGFETFKNFGAINFNILSMFSFPSLSDFFYSFSIFSIIGIIMVLLSLVIIFYSVKNSNQKLDIKNNFVDYVSYLFIYSLIMTLFWSDSIINKIFFRKKSVGWKYG